MAAKSISIPVTGNTAPLRKSLNDATKQLQRFADQSKKDLKQSAKQFTVVTGAVGAMAAAFYMGYQRAEQANQRLAAVNKTMGLFGRGTAEVTRRMQEFADQLERETGFTAESIKETQAKLLTFKNLAISADEVGGAFDRATIAAVDLSAAGFGDATNNAVQLGKAMQDPIKGITALARSGVTFTAQEKAKIRTLVETNHVMEAQDVILSAIETQVKGTAKSTATATTRMKNSLGEATDIIGEALAPAIESAANGMADFAGLVTRHQAVFTASAIALGGISIAIVGVRVAMAASTAVSTAYALAQAGVASANLAVQASTIVGIASAVAAAGVIAVLTKKVYDNVKARESEKQANIDAARAAGVLITTQAELNAYMGPVPSRDLATFQDHYNRWAISLETAADTSGKATSKMEKMKEALKDTKTAIRDYVAGIRDAITGTVSLSTAFSQADSEQATAADNLNEALKTRAAAYAALNQAKVTGDAKAYGAALADVADAEKAVTDAQAVKPKNYSQIFADQIAAAKSFAGYIKQLVTAGLGKAGLAQLLDLGPVAGSQVAKDLLAGTGGMTVAGLNADLAAVADAGTAAGMAIPGFSAALGATVGGTANAPTIVIQAGVGDPVAIGKEVAGVLNTYGTKTGGVPIVVKQPKAPTKKKTSGRRKGGSG